MENVDLSYIVLVLLQAQDAPKVPSERDKLIHDTSYVKVYLLRSNVLLLLVVSTPKRPALMSFSDQFQFLLPSSQEPGPF